MVDVPIQQHGCEKIMSEPIDEMQKHLAEAEAEIARFKGEIPGIDVLRPEFAAFF